MNKKHTIVGVLMVNYNQWELTRKCIETVLQSQGISVVISLVDNNSREPVPSWVRETSQITFYQNNDNLGFIAGNIRAFEMVVQHGVNYIILLNTDTEVEPDTLRLLAENFAKHPDSGLVTPAITYADARNTIWHAGGTFIPYKMCANQLYKTVDDLPENETETDLVSGCAMMMRPELFKEIGYQNPDLFLYHEDVEQSLRAKEMGFRNYLVPAARVIHRVSSSAGGVLSPLAVYFTHRNRYIFAVRNLKRTDLLKFRLYYLAVTVAKSFIYPLRGNSNLVRWIWLAFVHGLRNTPSKKPAELFAGK